MENSFVIVLGKIERQVELLVLLFYVIDVALLSTKTKEGAKTSERTKKN